ncbi:MAG: hypothetical protein WA608_10780, partial [Candidatus Acidiferrales bacterium]
EVGARDSWRGLHRRREAGVAREKAAARRRTPYGLSCRSNGWMYAVVLGQKRDPSLRQAGLAALPSRLHSGRAG